MARKKSQALRSEALRKLEALGGVFRTSEATEAGIHPRILYELRDAGAIQQLDKGLYCLPNLPQIDQPDLVTVAKKVPEGVICLTSALFFHGLTVQIPRWVDIAVRRGHRSINLQHPPIQFHWFSDRMFEEGIEVHRFGNARVRIYSKEKSIVDCFRLRKKVGAEVAVEALKNYWAEGNADLALLRELAKSSRVLSTMEPYIEAVTHDQS